jgi:transcriptional regulator with XRE-family HTH domain
MAEEPSHKKSITSQKPGNYPELTSPFLSGLGDTDTSVGKRVREIRILRGLSMRALAEKSGLNINTLSLIENERTSPSVSTLQQIAQSLQVFVTEFFQRNHGNKRLVYQKRGKRPWVAFEYSTMEDLAPGMPRFGAEPIIVTLEPNADSGKRPIVHTGREFVYCLDGHISYTVDNESYLLESGDSLIFEAYLPHHWKNIDATPSRALLVLCPMDDRDQPKERHFAR